MSVKTLQTNFTHKKYKFETDDEVYSNESDDGCEHEIRSMVDV